MAEPKVRDKKKGAGSMKELLGEGYRALVLQQDDRAATTQWGRDSLDKNPALRIEAGREVARLDELQRKMNGRLENRCYMSAKHLEFLKSILGNNNG